MSVALDTFRPRLRCAMPARRQQRAVQADPPMRTWANPRVVGVTPIGQVVATLSTGCSVVRHFVWCETETYGLLRRRKIQRGRVIALRQHDLAARVLGGERRAR